MAKYRRKAISIKRTPVIVSGGPFAGQVLRLSSPGTLTFTVNGETGRYNEAGEWVPVQGEGK